MLAINQNFVDALVDLIKTYDKEIAELKAKLSDREKLIQYLLDNEFQDNERVTEYINDWLNQPVK